MGLGTPLFAPPVMLKFCPIWLRSSKPRVLLMQLLHIHQCRCFENAWSGGRSLSGCHSRIENQNQFFQQKPLQGGTNTQQNMQDKPSRMFKPPHFPHKASTNGHLVAPSNPSFIPSTNHMVGTPYLVKRLYELTFLLRMLLNQL